MKKTLLLSLFLAAIFFSFSCKKTSLEYFLIAEQMVDSQPENSIILLKSVDRTAFSDEYNARWAIAVTQAQDKINRRHTSDSLIKTAIRYYEQHYNPRKLGKACYYMARVSQELQNASIAQEYYLRALDLGETSKDTFQLVLVCNQLGRLYTSQYSYNDALFYFKKALDNLALTNDTVSQTFILRNIARNYALVDSIDHSIDYYREALRFAHSNIRPSILTELGDRLTQKQDYYSAYTYLREAVDSADKDDLPMASLNIGRYFAETNQPDSAIRYLNRCINNPKLETRLGAYRYLAKLSRNTRRYADYAKYQTQYESLRDTFETRLHTQTTMELQALYNHQKIQKIATKAIEDSKRLWLNFCIALICALVLLSCFTIYYIRTQLQRMRDTNAQRSVFLKFHNLEMKRTRAQVETNLKAIDKLHIQWRTVKKKEMPLPTRCIFSNSPISGYSKTWKIKKRPKNSIPAPSFFCACIMTGK